MARLRRQINELVDENAASVKIIDDMSLDFQRLKELPQMLEDKEREIRSHKDYQDELNASISVNTKSIKTINIHISIHTE